MLGSLEKKITLDLDRLGVQERICARQGDSLVHRVLINITSGGKPYKLSGVVYARVCGLLPDGSAVTAEADITDNTVSFVPGTSFFAKGGSVICRLILHGDDGSELCCPAFAIDADPSFAAVCDAVPDEKYSKLEKLLMSVLEAKSICETIAEEICNGDYSTPLSDSDTAMNGEAYPGTSPEAARADHVHPTDTSRMPAATELALTTEYDVADTFPLYDTSEKVTKKMMLGRLFALIRDTIRVPTKLSELESDSTHRTVTDAEKAAWDSKSDFSGAYADLTGKPTIPTVPTNVSAFNNDAGYVTDDDLDAAVDELSEKIDDLGGARSTVDNAVGTTYPPAQRDADSRIDGSDIHMDLYLDGDGDLMPTDSATSDDIHTYIDTVTDNLKNRVTKELLGKDTSGNFDMMRYTVCNRQHIAWVRKNYPKMYAWKNGDTTMYTESVSPRIGEKAYDVPYVKTTNTQVVTKPKFTNLKEQCVYKYEMRWSMSGGGWKTVSGGNITTILVPVPTGSTSVTIRLKGVSPHTSYTKVYGGADSVALTESCIPDDDQFDYRYLGSDGVYTVPCTKSATTSYISFNVQGTSASDFTDIIVTVDEPIEYETVEEEIEGETGTPITSVSATNRSRTIGGAVYTRYESGDISPTVIYTDADDDRNTNATITKGGITYIRYPLGDLLANKKRPIPIFVYANEHGVRSTETVGNGKWETKLCALVAARMVRDFGLEKQSQNPLYKYILENCMLIVIPVVNPYGFNHYLTDVTMGDYDGYCNFSGCNINRNYDCPGYDVMNPNGTYTEFGAYVGSENETQYVMNTMVESGAVVAMSLHGVGGYIGYCAHQGQNPNPNATGDSDKYVDYDQEKLAKVYDILFDTYGIKLRYYDLNSDGTPAVCINTPDITSKSPSYISQCGAYGGIVEFQPVKAGGVMGEHSMEQVVIETAYCQTLNLMAMWLSDYLESK